MAGVKALGWGGRLPRISLWGLPLPLALGLWLANSGSPPALLPTHAKLFALGRHCLYLFPSSSFYHMRQAGWPLLVGCLMHQQPATWHLTLFRIRTLHWAPPAAFAENHSVSKGFLPRHLTLFPRGNHCTRTSSVTVNISWHFLKGRRLGGRNFSSVPHTHSVESLPAAVR